MKIPSYATRVYIHSPYSTDNIYIFLSLSLLLPLLWGINLFGFTIALPLICSVGGALLSELVGIKLLGKKNHFWSILFYGLLNGFFFAANTNLLFPFITSFTGLLVARGFYGGLGRNWIHPILWSYIIAKLSWGSFFNQWKWPSVMNIEGTDQNPLYLLKSMLRGESPVIGGPLGALEALEYPKSGWDGTVTSFFNNIFFDNISLSLPEGYVDMISGQYPGYLGESTSALIIIAGMILIIMGIIDWLIPTIYIVSFTIIIYVLGGIPFESGFFTGDVLFHLSTGFFWLSAIYILPDLTVSPSSSQGRVIYALTAGVLAALLRTFSPFTDGVLEALLFTTLMVPLLNRIPSRISDKKMRRY